MCDLEDLEKAYHKAGMSGDDLAIDNAIEAIICRAKEECAHTDNIKSVVNKQAEDKGLWFQAETAAEAYLQQELRHLHATVEATKGSE